MADDQVDPNSEAAVRKQIADALKTLADVAQSGDATPELRAEARRTLEKYLSKIEEMQADPSTPNDVRADIERALREFRGT